MEPYLSESQLLGVGTVAREDCCFHTLLVWLPRILGLVMMWDRILDYMDLQFDPAELSLCL